MEQDTYARIRSHPKFRELVESRGRFALRLSILMLAIYYGFILLVAFAPGVLGIPIFGVITLGIPVGILIIIAAFALTGVYVAKANTEFDELNQEILEGTE
jgi:uncharacterized membrane protein (DUF485 family)